MNRVQERCVKEQGYQHDLYDEFRWDVGDGWYELVRGLCSEIEAAYEKAGQPIDLIVDRIREKFGTMRVYYHFEGQPQPVQVFACSDAEITIRYRPKETELQKGLADIVQRWETESATVCEECGRPGKLRENGRSLTLCDKCASSHEAYCRYCRQ